MAHDRPAGEVLYAFLRDSGMLARLARTPTTAAEEGLGNVARFFDIIRAQSALLADDRAMFVAGHLQTLIEAGDDPATADLDPDADAVAVLTVHKAKGLEFPVVYLPGMVAGRFPGNGRGDALALPAGLGRAADPTAEGSLAEERRLCYVAMTRARDELILSHAADYGGARARKVSPFVLEALDLPAAAAPGAGIVPPSAEERLATFAAVDAPVEAERGPIDEPLSLSFGQVDAYLTCPLKYKYAHVLRVPTAPHHALVYGAAMHKAVQLFHHRHARGHVMSEAELDEVLDSAWSNEGFVSREHEEARLAAARASLRRFREEQLLPGAVIPTYVEREFSFSLGGDRIRGRWDRVDVQPAAPDAPPDPAAERPLRRSRHADARDHGPRARDHHRLQGHGPARPRARPPARPRVAPAPDLRDGLRGADRPPAGPARAALPRFGAGRQGGRRPQAPRQGARADRDGRGRHPRPGLPRHAGRDGLLVVPVPRYLPVERAPRRDRASAQGDSTRRGPPPCPVRGAPRLARTRRARSIMRLERVVRPWAWDGADTLDSLAMESRDRLVNLAIFAAAAVVWVLVALIVTTRDPIADPRGRVHRGGAHRARGRPDLDPDRVAPACSGATGGSPTGATGPGRPGAAAGSA